MRVIRRLRPTPAMAVACVALFVALGGVGYAAATINGSSIKNGTITPGKIKSRSLSGTQFRANGIGGPSIKESTLGEVPKAKAAQTATTATNATNATKATTAENATQLGGAAASSYVRYGAIAAGQTLSGAFGCQQGSTPTECRSTVSFPAPAPSPLNDNTVNFAASVLNVNATDADATCTGNVNEPTAPPGKVCLYLASNYEGNALTAQGDALANTNGSRGFTVLVTPDTVPETVDVAGVWAYTAP
jgi:hypothetical protein